VERGASHLEKLLDEVHKSELEYSSGKAKQATAAEITETLVKIKDGTSVRL
jgi:hypothetical protein